MIPAMVMPKKRASNCHFMTFFKIRPSGMEMVTMAVMNAKAVPRGTPLPTKVSIFNVFFYMQFLDKDAAEYGYGDADKVIKHGHLHPEYGRE